jgi:serine phosphatase RsbU (regulator of sigma subunit)
MLYSLPPITPLRYVDPSLEFSANLWSTPADGAQLGGDWCDVHRLSDTQLALAIFDVAGHGEPAVATMQALRSVLFMAMRSGVAASAMLSLANAVACARDEGLIVTALVGILDGRRGEFTFANAGHPSPLLMTAGGYKFCSKPVGDLPLGIFPNFGIELQTVAIPPDALLVLYTDGLVEHNRDIDSGELELIEAARAVYGVPALHAAKTIATHLFESGRGVDDAALIAIRASNAFSTPDRKPAFNLPDSRFARRHLALVTSQ